MVLLLLAEELAVELEVLLEDDELLLDWLELIVVVGATVVFSTSSEVPAAILS